MVKHRRLAHDGRRIHGGRLVQGPHLCGKVRSIARWRALRLRSAQGQESTNELLGRVDRRQQTALASRACSVASGDDLRRWWTVQGELPTGGSRSPSRSPRSHGRRPRTRHGFGPLPCFDERSRRAEWTGRDQNNRLVFTKAGCVFAREGGKDVLLADMNGLSPRTEAPPLWAMQPLGPRKPTK